MAKAKPRAAIRVPDSSGNLVRVEDHRFDRDNWPIEFEIPKERADTWLRYLSAECMKRGWSSAGIGQIESSENSGSVTISVTHPSNARLVVVWERRRAQSLKIRSRLLGTPEFALPTAQEFFDRVNEASESGAVHQRYYRGQLHYYGLPWRGELWLDDTIRLGPPSQQYEVALLGPRVVLVDALLQCISPEDLPWIARHTLQELSAFLSVILGIYVNLPAQRWAWTVVNDSMNSEVRNLGYIEPIFLNEMPRQGACPAIPLSKVDRPELSHAGFTSDVTEQALPDDVNSLWRNFRALTADYRRNFLQAAAKWQEALSHQHERQTLSFALMVVACEALKPAEPQYRDHNIYDVVKALLGPEPAGRLRENLLGPQKVRSEHLHRGEFHSSEFLVRTMTSSFEDPTFYQSHRDLHAIAQATIIEWLRRSGNFRMPLLKKRKTFKRLVKEHALALIPTMTVLAAIAGFSLHWYLQLRLAAPLPH